MQTEVSLASAYWGYKMENPWQTLTKRQSKYKEPLFTTDWDLQDGKEVYHNNKAYSHLNEYYEPEKGEIGTYIKPQSYIFQDSAGDNKKPSLSDLLKLIQDQQVKQQLMRGEE